jgi:hypothetical protein
MDGVAQTFTAVALPRFFEKVSVGGKREETLATNRRSLRTGENLFIQRYHEFKETLPSW